MEDTWTKITARMNQLKPMHTRMDKTRDLVYQEPYVPVDAEGQPLTGVIPVTGNIGSTYGNTVIQDLLRAEWQTVVEGLTGNQSHKLEEFIEHNLDQVDEYLLEQYGLPGLYEWLCNHVCVRGPIGVEFYPWVEGDSYNIHCLPADMRYVAYHPRMKWVAPILFMNKEELEETVREQAVQHPELKNYKYAGKGKSEIEVRDHWDGENNELWVDQKLVYSNPNPFGKPPFVIVFPPAGFLLRDKGYIKHEAEDIFFLMRGLNDEMNRTLSIEQSLIFNVLRPPYEYEVLTEDASPTKPPPVSGETIKVKQGERHVPIPTGDFNRANISAKQDIQRMMAEGAPIAPRLYTTPPSGAELVAEMEALARLQNSRLIALKVFKEQHARLMIDQYITLAKAYPSLNIGKRGKRKSFSVSVLKDPDSYTLSYQGKMSNKRMELANLAMFAAAYDRLPLKYSLQNILMVDDPDGVMREMEMEQAKKADPAISLYQMARSYAQEAAEIDDESEADALKIQSMMLVERAVAIIEQRKQPAQLPEKAQTPQVERPTGGTQALTALMGAGTPAMPKAPEEEA